MTDNNSKNCFSLIIPFQNDRKHVKQCIESVMAQKFVDFEVIFINLNSTDGTDKIIAKYAKSNDNIVLVNNTVITNINQAYNYGIALSKGKYIKIMGASSTLDSKALLILSKMMENEKTDIAFHLKSEAVNDKRLIPQSHEIFKNYISPVYCFSIFDKIIQIDDLENFLAFKKEMFVENNLFFDDELDLFDISKIFKMFFINKKVSVVYYDFTTEYSLHRLITADSNICLENFDKIRKNISEYAKENRFAEIFKNSLDSFNLNYLARISKFSAETEKEKIVSKADLLVKNFNFDYTLSREICNYKNIIRQNDCIRLSIIYMFNDVTEILQNYVNNFLNKSNLYAELILMHTDLKSADLNKLFPDCSQLKYIQSDDLYKVIQNQVNGEYFIIQNDKDVCFEDLFNTISYVAGINADMAFVPVKDREYDSKKVSDEYLKSDKRTFAYTNIYANKLIDLLYGGSEIIYKTEYIIKLFAESFFIDEEFLSLVSVLSSNSVTLYPQFVSAYKQNKAPDYGETEKIFSYMTSKKLQDLAKYEKLLYKMGVPDVESFYKKLYYRNLHHSKKMESLVADVDENEQYLKDRMDVLNSGLWDERFYLKQFDYSISKIDIDPLDHYLTEGWKKGFSPSEYFDGPAYSRQHFTGYQNPLIFYLNVGRFNYKTYPVNPYNISDENITAYWKNKKKNKKVVYMCITGNYDSLEEIKAHRYVNPEWDYVCFTDNKDYISQKKVGIWQIKPLRFTELDNTRNNRWHKVHPHILFPQYEESIYLDSNINILTPFLFEEIKKRNTDLLLPKHANNFSLYNEYVWAMRAGVDRLDVIMRECEEIIKQGFPFYYGFTECNIIYRRHSSKVVAELMADWWYWIKTYAKRDQLSFSYLLWKYHIKVNSCTFVNARVDYKDFCVFLHPRDRK